MASADRIAVPESFAIRYNKTHNPVITMETRRAKQEQRAAIAKRFKWLRRKVPFTQSELGKYIGLCRTSVNRIERRRVTPRLSTWSRFLAFEAKHQQPAVRMPTHWS